MYYIFIAGPRGAEKIPSALNKFQFCDVYGGAMCRTRNCKQSRLGLTQKKMLAKSDAGAREEFVRKT